MKKLINKRQIVRRNSKYFVRWKKYSFQYDEWKNLFELNNVKKLIQQYDEVKIIIFFNRRWQIVVVDSKKFFSNIVVINFKQQNVDFIVVNSWQRFVIVILSKSIVVDITKFIAIVEIIKFATIFSIFFESRRFIRLLKWKKN